MDIFKKTSISYVQELEDRRQQRTPLDKFWFVVKNRITPSIGTVHLWVLKYEVKFYLEGS